LLCQHVHADLRNLLRSETPVYRRQVMRTYGLTFEPTSGEEAPIPEPTTVVLPTIPSRSTVYRRVCWRVVELVVQGRTELLGM
jgi:hypothetical protein